MTVSCKKLKTKSGLASVFKHIALVAVLAGVTSLTGCTLLLIGAAAGAGAAGVAYVNGDLEATLDGEPRVVAIAAKKAFKSMDIKLVSSSSSAVDAEIVGRNASDDKIMVEVSSESNTNSEVSIRIGAFGDEKMSVRVLDEIKKFLPEAKKEFEKKDA